MQHNYKQNINTITGTAPPVQANLCPYPVGEVQVFNTSTHPNNMWTNSYWEQVDDLTAIYSGPSASVGTIVGSNTNSVLSHSHTCNTGGSHTHSRNPGSGYAFTSSTTRQNNVGRITSTTNYPAATSTSTTSAPSHTHTIDYRGQSGAFDNCVPSTLVKIYRRVS